MYVFWAIRDPFSSTLIFYIAAFAFLLSRCLICCFPLFFSVCLVSLCLVLVVLLCFLLFRFFAFPRFRLFFVVSFQSPWFCVSVPLCCSAFLLFCVFAVLPCCFSFGCCLIHTSLLCFLLCCKLLFCYLMGGYCPKPFQNVSVHVHHRRTRQVHGT